MVNFIEFPTFDGVSGDLWQWILWLEDFFVRERFTADEKMNLAQSLLEGKAYAWFYRNQKILIFQSWKELRDSLWLMFGDFEDSDRFLRRKRRSRTAITPQESISSPATIHETVPVAKFSTQQVDEISVEKKDESHEATIVKVLDSLEEESITQSQVPVSSLEPGLSFSSEIIDVSVAWPYEMVSINRVHLQAGVECVKNKTNAHHVLDELLLRRHKFQQRKKPSLSPKSRMFKFKNRSLLSNWSQLDLHQIIDISKVNNLYPCFSANFGLVRQKQTIQCLRLTKLAHKSKALYHLRMLHDPGGTDDEHSVDINYSQLSDEHKASACADVKCSETATYAPAMQTEGWDDTCAAARDALESTGTWIVTSLPANDIEEAVLKVVTKPVTEGKTTGFKEVFMMLAAPVSLLNCFNLPLHHVPNNGLLVFPWNLLLLEFSLSIHLEDKVCLSGASNSGCGWLVFDRGKSNIISGDVITLVSIKEFWVEILDGDIVKLLNSTCGKLQSYDYGLEITFLRRLRVNQQQQKRKFIKSWGFKYKSSLRNTRSESREMNQFVGFMKFQLKHKWRSKHLHTISALGFYLSSVFSTVTSAHSGRLPGLLEQVLQRDDEAYIKILDKLLLNLKQGMDLHGASGLRLFLSQQKFSSIWHRWRRKDWELEVPLRERDLMLSQVQHISQRTQAIMKQGLTHMHICLFTRAQFSFFKLEDKLVLRGESIDTIHQLMTWQWLSSNERLETDQRVCRLVE